ncbi:MAG TPA: phosphate/phosphite/phosphonate ABC transporter substrate-binding protein [Acetobacteraceae bacterium]|jgi:phosphonate transport system substrate-binding protein|nr:phosphate/phosphite/phosphonate ABC transporter substrate-binding protein [Acetobacteraceae bacterium]
MKSVRKSKLTLALGAVLSLAAGSAHAAGICPAGSAVRFGVEPYESTAALLPVYNDIGKLIAKQVGCPVQIFITTSYNAEIEAMRAGKLEIGEFGPLGYVLAHKVADAQAVATFADRNGQASTYTASIVTWPGSGITTLKGVAGHTFAYSDPDSTSGHLFPAYALKKAGIDPDHGVKAFYAGSHTASYEAILHHKVQAGELNSQQIALAVIQKDYDPKNFVVLWQSNPIPIDPVTIYGKLTPALAAKLTAVLQHLDLSALSPADLKILGAAGGRLAPQTDSAYDGIRDLITILHIDLNKLS